LHPVEVEIGVGELGGAGLVAATPVVDEGRVAATPVVDEGRVAATPVVDEGRVAATPVVDEGRVAATPVVEGRDGDGDGTCLVLPAVTVMSAQVV